MRIIQPLKVARAEHNMSQKELAELADVSAVTISFIENGRVLPYQKTRQKIEAVLGEIDWLRTFDEGLVQHSTITN